MIKVNLLPAQVKRAQVALSLAALPWPQIGKTLGGLLALYSIWLVVDGQRQANTLRRLQAQWEELQPQWLKWKEVDAAFRALQNRAAVFQSLKAPEAQWAPRLNLLSDVLVSGLWFTQLRYRATPSSRETEMGMSPDDPQTQATPLTPLLELRGSALSASKEVAAPVSRYLQRLREHPEFHRWFKSLELKTVEHRQIDQYEVTNFEMVLAPTGEQTS